VVHDSRPIGIGFLGHASPRRERFFADHAAAFSARTCRLHFVDLAHPRQANTPGYVTGEARAQLLGQTKILISLHAAERPYFERHRALLAFAHGCAVVTETSTGTAPLVDGTHFVMAPLSELAEPSLRLLDDPDRRVAIAAAGHRMASQLSMADSCRSMLEHAAGAETTDVSGADEAQERRAVRQRLAESRAIRDRGDCDWDHYDNAAWRWGATARISVIVTVHNYAGYLDECVQSVLASQPVPGGFELLIIDDASHDGSAERARTLADGAAIPVSVVAKHANTGLGDARNLGVQLARGSLVLTLDADNWIFPACLRLLAEALADETVAAAYPLLRRFHDGTGASAGLLSVFPWSPRELVRGPYIDALAMFRRDVLIAAGGYATDLVDHGWFGWEDYDLWLTLARTGHVCRQVPAVLASYRVHERSMIGRTNRSTEAMARHLADKHASLICQHPGLDRYLGFPATTIGGAAPLASLDSMALAQRCRDLGDEVQALRASWSWRVTAPLRFVYRQLGLERR
jgi:GT2 family glycosyltransferase